MLIWLKLGTHVLVFRVSGTCRKEGPVICPVQTLSLLSFVFDARDLEKLEKLEKLDCHTIK